MHAAFGIVVWVVCGLGLLAAFAALVLSGKTWEEYGKNRLLMEGESPTGPKPGSAAALLERDAEIRQLLEARNARNLRRGEAPIDVEEELRRLTGPAIDPDLRAEIRDPAIDPDLRAEIRDLVIARNHRRARAGKPPLDVEAEIERQIASLHSP